MDGRRKTTVQSLQRGLEVLEAIGRADQPVGITDLSRQFGLAKGSISRLVATLVEQAFVIRDPTTAKYQLSMKMWELGNEVVSRLDIRDIARSVLGELNVVTHETVHLTVLTERNELVFLDKLDSSRAVRPNIEVGALLPAYCVANGKAMLAFMPKARVEQVLKGKLRQLTPATVTRKSALATQFEEIRRTGYAVNRGEYRPDVWGLAAPIFNHTGFAVAALGISVPAQRVTQSLIDDLAPRLVTSARQISLALGHRDDDASSSDAPDGERTGRGSRAARAIAAPDVPAPPRGAA